MYLNYPSADFHKHQKTTMILNQRNTQKITFMSFHTRKILSSYVKNSENKGSKNIYGPQLVLSMKMLFL